MNCEQKLNSIYDDMNTLKSSIGEIKKDIKIIKTSTSGDIDLSSIENVLTEFYTNSINDTYLIKKFLGLI